MGFKNHIIFEDGLGWVSTSGKILRKMVWVIIIFWFLIHAHRRNNCYVDRWIYFHSLMLKEEDFLQLYEQKWFQGCLQRHPWVPLEICIPFCVETSPDDLLCSERHSTSWFLGRMGWIPPVGLWLDSCFHKPQNKKKPRRSKPSSPPQVLPKHYQLCLENATNIPRQFCKEQPPHMNCVGRGTDIRIDICPLNSALKL